MVSSIATWSLLTTIRANQAIAVFSAGHSQVTLDWTAADGATGYNVYYDQAGKAQFIADAGNTLTYLDTGLTNGIEYCYMVTAYNDTCESGYSSILCRPLASDA